MHIIVCIKQTPATANIQIDPKTGTLKREGMAAAINPFDEYAIEEAVRIKEKIPGTIVSVVTMQDRRKPKRPFATPLRAAVIKRFM